jgi:hypothetical protein
MQEGGTSINMCYYISFAINSDIHHKAYMMLSSNLDLQPNKNKSFRALVPNTFHTYFLTTEVCSCELYEKTENQIYGFRADVQHYFHRLARYTKNIFIHIHFYRSETETESLPITHTEHINLAHMMTTQLDQDCLYQILLDKY